MARALLSPIMDACKAIAESSGFPVGMSDAPDCDPPYIIISSVSGPRYDGPFGDMEADSSDRIQFSYMGITQQQADALRDKLRAELTLDALDAQFVAQSANRRTFRIILDIPRGVQRDDRGLPEPRFLGIDQYLVETTPA